MRKKPEKVDGQLALFSEHEQQNQSLEHLCDFKNVDKVLSDRRRSFSSKEEYYQSDEWRYVRYRKFKQVGRKCEECGSTKRIEVHHKTYDRLYDEDLADLQVLCFGCHPTADWHRAEGNAFYTYVSKVHGDDVQDPSIYAEEFEAWLERKEAEW